MAITILENGWVSDSFQMGKEPLIYGDALVMPAEEYNMLTEEQIQTLKNERYQNWLQIINGTNQPLPVVPITE